MTDEDFVIAGAHLRVMPAFEPRDAAGDARCVGPPECEFDAREAIGMRPRKSPRELDLPSVFG